MCARFPLTVPSEVIQREFFIDLPPGRPKRYNIAPTQNVLGVVPKNGGREARLFRWGLIPYWAKDLKIGTQLINARAETLQEKPSFRRSFERRRCAIPCSGFYEWETVGKLKKPLLFTVRDAPVMAFAGLWDVWRGSGDEELQSCTLVTTEANELVRPFHDRMPVLLDPDEVGSWIDPAAPVKDLLALLTPFPETRLEVDRVDSSINNSRTEAELSQLESV